MNAEKSYDSLTDDYDGYDESRYQEYLAYKKNGFEKKANQSDLPNHKAHRYPIMTKIPSEINSEGNPQYHGASIYSEIFTKPFHTGNSDPSSPQPYVENLKGAALPQLFAKNGEIKNLMDTVTGNLETLTDKIASDLKGDVTGINNYSSPSNPCVVDEGDDTLINKSRNAILGFLYDLLHFNTIKQIRKSQGLPSSTLDILVYILQRDGRAYFLLFALLLIILLICLLKYLFSRSTHDSSLDYVYPIKALYPMGSFQSIHPLHQ